MNDCTILETERLILRRPGNQDIPAIIAIAGDLEVSRRLTRVPHPYGEADARYFLEEILPTEWCWGITLRPSDTLIGMIGLTQDDEAAELGYYMDRQHWGQGIVTEAARSVIHYGLNVLNLPHIVSGYHLNNPASGRVLAKLGFIQVGLGERDCLATGTMEWSVDMLLQPDST